MALMQGRAMSSRLPEKPSRPQRTRTVGSDRLTRCSGVRSGAELARRKSDITGISIGDVEEHMDHDHSRACHEGVKRCGATNQGRCSHARTVTVGVGFALRWNAIARTPATRTGALVGQRWWRSMNRLPRKDQRNPAERVHRAPPPS